MRSYLQYLDANNLCGGAMSQLLQIRGFEWVDDDDVSKYKPDEIGSLAKDNSKGYLLEVDVKYPKELHDLHNSHLFVCGKMKINRVEQLVPNLNDKEKYVVHIKALNQALKHGLIFKKVHQVIKFNQSAWSKPYIDFNTQLRTQAKDDFEKDFFKLIFGKTMENIGKHKGISSS